jgi:hypothetical protein
MTAVKTLWGPAAIGNVTAAAAALSGTALTDADNAVGWSFCVPADGSITDVGVYLTLENGTSPAYNCGLVTLDSSGRPTTTAYGGSAVTSAQWTSVGWKWVTLSTPATANAGDFAAVHVYPTGTAPDVSNNVSIIGPTGIVVSNGDGSALSYTTAWSATAGLPPMAIRYNTGAIHGLALASNTIHVQVRSNTTPDEVGNLFQVPAAMTCTGARLFAYGAGWGASATAEVILYNAAGTALATATISDRDFVDDSATLNVYWDAVSLSALTDYRLIIKPGVAAGGDIYTPKWTFESEAGVAAVPEGVRWQYTSRADAGAWTNDNVSVCPMGLWVSDITFSAGGATTYEYGYIG